MTVQDEGERFLQQAVELQLLDEEQAAHCRLVDRILRDFDHAKRMDEIVTRKGFLRRKQAALVWKSLDEKRVGRYEILDKIGAGGFGKVYRARDTKLDRVVALKVLAREYSEDEDVRSRFLREARVSMQLNHVNIVHGLDFGEASGYSYLAMEFVPGETLAEKLAREQKLDEHEAFDIARQVVDALEYVQGYALVHRDIKPSNLILTPDGQVKVLDLGLTRPTLHEAKEVGVETTAQGTAMYTSPEQIQRPDNIDWRADQYSLGATLYHMLTGTPPFKGDSAREIMEHHIKTSPQDPRDFVLGLSNGATTVTLKMLHKDPLQRYAEFDALHEDLAAVCDGRVPTHTLSVAPVTAQKPAPSLSPPGAKHSGARHVHTPRTSRRKKGPPVVGIAVVAVMVVVGAIFALSGGGPDGKDPSSAGTPSAGAAPPQQQPDDDGSSDASAPSPSREELARAKLHRQERPDDFAGIRERLELVVGEHGGTPAAEEAQALLEELDAEVETAAGRERDRLVALAEQAEAEGRLSDAWSTLATFSEAYADTAAARDVATAAARTETAALRAVVEALGDARRAAADRRFDDAETALAVAERSGTPSTSEDIAAARDEVAQKRLDYGRARAAQQGEVDLLSARVLLAAGSGNVDAARALLAARRDDLPAFAAETAALEQDVARVERIRAAVVTEWRGMDGDDVDVGTPRAALPRAIGKAAGVRDGRLAVDLADGGRADLGVEDLAPADAFRIASSSRDPMARPAPDAAFPYALACGDLTYARSLLAEHATGPEHVARRRLVEVLTEHLGEQVRQLLDLAERSRKGGSPRGERDALERAIQLMPGSTVVRLALARRAFADKDTAGARSHLDVVLASPDPPAAAHLLDARLHESRRDEEATRAAYARFLEGADDGDPERATAEARIAEITAKLNTSAAKDLRKAADRVFRRKEWAAAAKGYADVLALDPTDADAMQRLGEASFELNRFFDAFKWLTLFVAENPRDRKAGEARRMLETLEERRKPRDVDLATERQAVAAAKDGKLDEAVALYEKALVWSPFLESARLGLAQAHLRRGAAPGGTAALEAAAEAAGDLLLVAPGHAGALLVRVEAYRGLGRTDEALAAAEELIKADEKNAAACLLAGEIHLDADRLDAARERFAEAYMRDESAAALYGSGRVSMKEGRYTEAADLFRQALQRHVVTAELKAQLEAAIREAEAHNR